MEKLVYLCWKRESESLEQFRAALLGDVASTILGAGVQSLQVNVADVGEAAADSPLIIGEGASMSASVSLWLESVDQRGVVDEALDGISDRAWSYSVTESVPLAYADRDWLDAERSPGVTLFTAFPKPARLSDEEFFDFWHGSHTPLSFELHPLWRYVRNTVSRVLTKGAAPYRAIVEERFRTLETCTDIMQLFKGSTENMQRGMADVARFIDRDEMNCNLMNEYILKS